MLRELKWHEPMHKYKEFVGVAAEAIAQRATYPSDIALLCSRIQAEALKQFEEVLERRKEAKRVLTAIKEAAQ